MDNPAGYEVGLRNEASGLTMHKVWDRATVVKSVGYLRAQNAKGEHIYIRPRRNEDSALVLVDDWSPAQLAKFKADGHVPVCVLETSPGNLQAWLRLPFETAEDPRTTVARWIVANYGGDPASADAAHYGRLAGFTNRKPKYENNGRFPFSRLIEAAGGKLSQGVMEAAIGFKRKTLADVTQVVRKACEDLQDAGEQGGNHAGRRATAGSNLPSVLGSDAHLTPVQLAAREKKLAAWYTKLWLLLEERHGLLFNASQADWMCAVGALRRGYSPESIEAVMIEASPGLATERKRGHAEDYATRTVWKAAAWVHAQDEGQEWDSVKDGLLMQAKALRSGMTPGREV